MQMRENINISFSPYEFKPIKAKMKELGMNAYQYGRFCMMREAGVEIDRENREENNQKPRTGRKNSESTENSGIINDIDE
jgi:hypothetical protein